MSSDFQIVAPVQITSSRLYTLNPANLAPETPPAVYNPATTYGAGAQVSVANGLAFDVYESRVAGNIGHTPASSPTYWQFVAQAFPLYGGTTGYLDGAIVTSTSTHHLYEAAPGSSSVVTMTIASPGVVTWAGHGMAADDPVKFTTTGALPTGLVAGTTYYVRSPAANTFQLAASPGGAAINTSGTQSGVHTASRNIGKAVTDTEFWLDRGATNRWAMFDLSNGTVTSMNGVMRVILYGLGRLDTIALLGVKAQEVRVTVSATPQYIPGGSATIVYDETHSMADYSGITDFYEYFTAEPEWKTELVITDIPFGGVEFMVQLRNLDNEGEVSLGNLLFGKAKTLGVTLAGAKLGIDDYSLKVDDGFGGFTITERAYAKRGDFEVVVAGESKEEVQGRVDFVYRTLAGYRATPLLFIATNAYGSATAFGYFRSFDVTVAYATQSLLTIGTQGLT